MPTVILLNPDDPVFSFEHMNAHRRYFSQMAPLDRFSALPYLLDPAYDTSIRASMWHLNHQRGHTDFATTLPPNYNAQPTEVGIPANQPLADSDLSAGASRTWWTFAQHHEHFLADSAILPLQRGTWPFW